MTAFDDDRLPLVLGGAIAAVVVALGAAALLLGPGRAGPGGGAPSARDGKSLSVPPGGGASGSAGGGPRATVSSGGRAGKDTVVVTMTDTLAFEADSVVIHVGGTILWKNTSVLIHTSTDDPASAAIEGDAVLPEGADPWNSGQLKPGESFARTFTVPGLYRYFCVPHEVAGMKGVIRVTEGSK